MAFANPERFEDIYGESQFPGGDASLANKNVLSSLPKTVKEYDRKLELLENENIDLKVKLYLLEKKFANCKKDNNDLSCSDNCIAQKTLNMDSNEKLDEKEMQTIQQDLKEFEQQVEMLGRKLEKTKSLLHMQSQMIEEKERLSEQEAEEMRGSYQDKEWAKELCEEVEGIDSEFKLTKEENNLISGSSTYFGKEAEEIETDVSEAFLNSDEKIPEHSKIKQRSDLLTDKVEAGVVNEAEEGPSFSDLSHQLLSISEDNVRRLLKMLESKDSLINCLLAKRKAEKAEAINTLKTHDKETTDLSVGGKYSESRLVKTWWMGDVVSRKISLQPKSSELDVRIKTTSEENKAKDVKENKTKQNLVGVDVNCIDEKNIKSKFNGVSCNFDDGESMKGNDYMGRFGDTFVQNSKDSALKDSSEVRIIPEKINIKRITSSSNTSGVYSVESGSVLCHKTRLTLPVSVQLTIEKRDIMKKLLDALKESDVEKETELTRKFKSNKDNPKMNENNTQQTVNQERNDSNQDQAFENDKKTHFRLHG